MRDKILDGIESAFDYLEREIRGYHPKVSIILGSGFSGWADQLLHIKTIPYAEIPGFPGTTVVGHSGNLVLAELHGQHILIMQGRFHFYEGHSMALISIPIRVFKKLGVNTVILTNAAGSINQSYRPGDIMVLEDHINLVQNNPLIGLNLDEFGPRFPDASQIYSAGLRHQALDTAARNGLSAHSGVYIFTSGPSFETPAEIRMMRNLGGDVVGMSTVPEAITACHAGMKVLGISLVANLGSGMTTQTLTHDDVMEAMEKVAPKINQFLNTLVPLI